MPRCVEFPERLFAQGLYVMKSAAFFICFVLSALVTHCPAADRTHAFQPGPGHASQIPASPRHFVPGYGYSSCAGHQATLRFRRLNRYSYYEFGRRHSRVLPGPFAYRHLSNSLGGPWFYPYAPINTRDMPWAAGFCDTPGQ